MNIQNPPQYFVFEVYIKDNTDIKGFRVDKVCGTSFVSVCEYYGSRNLPVLMIKSIHPITII